MHGIRTTIAMTGALVAMSLAHANAEDRVVLQLKGSSSRIALKCTILDYTGNSITVRTGRDSASKTYPTDQVIEIQTTYSQDHQDGLKHLNKQQTDKAISSLEKALRLEPRSWVRRDLLALLIRSALRKGDYASAGTRFQILFKSDSTTRHFKLVPLVWSAEQLNEEERSSARQWLLMSEPIAKLIGASLMLNDRQNGNAAEKALRTLKTDTDQRIRDLARIQLWRLKLRASELSRIQMELWEKDIQRISPEIRGGPYFLLARGHQIRQEFEQAASAFLWVSLVYDQDHRLAARATAEAASALRRLGQTNEAMTLYRELALRYRETEFAREIQDGGSESSNKGEKSPAIDSKR